jgi:mycothiol synthase
MSVEALALVLTDLTPQQRREYVAVTPGQAIEALVVGLVDGELVGAAWGQRQPGSTAIFWPPRWRETIDPDASVRLTCAAAQALDDLGIRMTQVLLPDSEASTVPALQAAGFARLTELMYLSWETTTPESSVSPGPQFEAYDESQRNRLEAAIEATYEETQDCIELGGKRPMQEVLDGYRETGTFRPENWLIVREGDADVGVLLMTEHRAAGHWELLYMGLAPSARGRKLGADVVRCAQRMAHEAGAERIVLAVDAENIPAIKMYNETGFVAWDRRTVFVRFAGENSQMRKTP